MSETPQQYTQRIMANAEGQDPIKVQSATTKKLARLIKGVPTAKLRKRPAPDKWSVSEILAHLADVEIVIGWRMRSILGAPGTPVQAYDQNAWVIAGHYEKRDPRKSIELHRSCAKPISRSSNRFPPINGSTSGSMPSAARNPSSTSSAWWPDTISTISTKSSAS